MGAMQWFTSLKKLVAIPTPEEATNPKFLKGFAYGALGLHMISKREEIWSKVSYVADMVTGMVKSAVQPVLDKFKNVKNPEQIGEVIGSMLTMQDQEAVLSKMPQAEKTIGCAG